MKIKFRISKRFFTTEWWTSRLSFIIRNEESLEEKHHVPYTPAKIIFFAFILFVFTFGSGFFLASKMFSGQTLSADDGETARQLYDLKYQVDSLTDEYNRQNNFLDNLSKILGEDVQYMKDDTPLTIDSSKPKKDKIVATKDSINIDYMDKAELRLREELEQGEQFLASYSRTNQSLKDLLLFSPIKGIVSEGYNISNNHYGVDIVAEKDEPIKAIAEGTVIVSSWTDDTGYVIAVQHQANLISVYKHCSSLLKKSGDYVKSGEIVAIIGNTGKFTTGPHLHFELWHQGNPVNPEELISF